MENIYALLIIQTSILYAKLFIIIRKVYERKYFEFESVIDPLL